MKKGKRIALDFEVDKLTNSIENILTGDSFLTDVSLVSKEDLKGIFKKADWLFDWKTKRNCQTEMFTNLLSLTTPPSFKD